MSYKNRNLFPIFLKNNPLGFKTNLTMNKLRRKSLKMIRLVRKRRANLRTLIIEMGVTKQ